MEQINLAEVLNKFNQYIAVEKNLSKRTTDAYLYDLSSFFSYYADKEDEGSSAIDLKQISADDIRNYLAFLQTEKRYKSTTLSRSLVSIRVFFDFCVQENVVQSSPVQYIHNPKLPKRLPIYLVESELKAILAAPDRETIWGKRDLAILFCLGLTGMRRQELINLDIDGIDLQSRTVKVFGKGAKERLIPLNDLVESALIEWLDVRPIDSRDQSAVFINQINGGRLTGRAIWDIVSKYLLKAGIPKDKISPHKLRHTFATLLHMKNVELVEIQKLLGHATIASTQIYTHTNMNQLRTAVNKLNDVID